MLDNDGMNARDRVAGAPIPAPLRLSDALAQTFIELRAKYDAGRMMEAAEIAVALGYQEEK